MTIHSDGVSVSSCSFKFVSVGGCNMSDSISPTKMHVHIIYTKDNLITNRDKSCKLIAQTQNVN